MSDYHGKCEDNIENSASNLFESGEVSSKHSDLEEDISDSEEYEPNIENGNLISDGEDIPQSFLKKNNANKDVNFITSQLEQSRISEGSFEKTPKEKLILSSQEYTSDSLSKNQIGLLTDSEDEEIIQTRSKRNVNVICISSDEEVEANQSIQNLYISSKLEDSRKPAISSSKDFFCEDTQCTYSKKEKSRISQDFNFSEIIDSQHSTPKNSLSGKRLLNKTSDTPKIFKQIKESDTPRKITQIILSSSEESNDENDLIDASDGESDQIKNKPIQMKQPTLKEFQKRKNTKDKNQFIEVSPQEYEEQSAKIRQTWTNFEKISELLKKINLDQLPDKGDSLQKRASLLESAHLGEVMKLSQMKVLKENHPKSILSNQNKIPTWVDIEVGTSHVVPRTFGKQAMATITAERKLTIDRLHQLHGSLKNCPTEADLGEPPKGLKVDLMTHQKRALLWLMWREQQKPSGGILADDMGLGKTLTMISLVLKSSQNKVNIDEDEENEEKSKLKFTGGTLVVCPASLINQWSSELERRTKRGLVSCELYHGPKRETKAKRLSEYDFVITTYSIISNECAKNGTIFRVRWRRIIIDEAHQIRNHKCNTSEAVCKLSAQSRWALTGTPVHNKGLDMYALMKFLKCSPFDDLKVWQRWVGDKNTGGNQRLQTVISSLMLRRTKEELVAKQQLNKLPERSWELMQVELTDAERGVYSKILIFSRTLFAQFLHQRAEKNQDDFDLNYNQNLAAGPNQEYFTMRQKLLRLNKLRDIKQHEILVLLLRLRQICCHPSLIIGMLKEDNDNDLLGNDEEEYDKGNALDLLDQLNKLTLQENNQLDNSVAADASEEGSSLKDVAKTVLSPSDAVFSASRMSSKIKTLIKLLKEKVLINDDKAIIVSQWPSFLNLIASHLKKEGLKYDQLDGNVPVHKRMEMVDRLNNPKDKLKILLLSLTAGGVGLNLIGANHLFLLDLHWNPQLEKQAQDRIYRMGQEKPVFVYKIMAADTIEKRILDLQEKKLDIANGMLTGSNQTSKNKLTLQDLKSLFEM